VQFNPLRLGKYYFLRLTRLKGDPNTLAKGVGFGIFIGILPLFPIQTALLISLTLLLRIHTITAVLAASIVSNPLTFAPQYYYTWKVGNFVLPGQVSWEHLQTTITTIHQQDLLDGVRTLTHLGYKALSVILAGGTIIGIPLAALGFYIGLHFFTALEKKRNARRKAQN